MPGGQVVQAAPPHSTRVSHHERCQHSPPPPWCYYCVLPWLRLSLPDCYEELEVGIFIRGSVSLGQFPSYLHCSSAVGRMCAVDG